MGDSFGVALFGLLYSAVLNEIEGRLISEGPVGGKAHMGRHG